MRYYLSSTEDEFILNFESLKKVGENLFCAQIDENEIWVRHLANKTFYSKDQKTWSLLAQISEDEITSNTQVYKLYRGFKPSSLFSGSSGDLITQMPGKVVKLLCSEGDEVKAGDTLLILEAMKMENEIKAGADGIVKTIHVKETQNLEAGTLMIELQS